MKYKIRLYSKCGDLIEERYTNTLKDAETIRDMHAVLIGITEKDFGLYPTIWQQNEYGNYIRILGY